MSLDDQFFPEDGTVVTRIDNTLIKAAGKVGEAYQQLTGKSYKDLYSKVLGTASVMTVGLAAYSQFLPFLFPAGQLFLERACPNFETPLEERVFFESQNKSPKMGAYKRMFHITLGSILVCESLIELYMSNRLSSLQKLITDGRPTSVELIAGAVLLTSAFGYYLSKSNPPKPPEKHVFAKAWEKTKEYFTPHPALPEPNPAAYLTLHS